MAPDIVVSHYPEGTGHATRMMAVARCLEDRGATVTLAGGGPGTRLYDVVGYEGRELTRVDYVEDFQEDEDTLSSLTRVLTGSIPDSITRLRDIVAWFRSERPDAVVTDDMFAAAAAALTRTPLYVLTHNAASLYRDWIVRAATHGLTVGQRVFARRFFYPTLWPPHAGDPAQVSRVPPVALESPASLTDGGPADPGVVLVPSTFSTGFGKLAERLRDAGWEVTDVGGPEWTVLPSLLPMLRRADVVICAGYSTMMDAAVAGTPCIVLPETNEQRGVARRLETVPGFSVVDSPAAIPAALSDPPDRPSFTNGAPVVAERMLDDLNRD